MRILHLLCACALFAPGFAQEPPRQGPGQGQGRQMQPYDASKEETIKATIKEVSEQARGPMTMVGLTVTVDGKDYQVMLASADFLKEKKASYAKDDKITIKGVKGESPRGLTIRAREVTKGENTLVLLDKDGRPVWRPQGGPQRGPQGGPPPQR